MSEYHPPLRPTPPHAFEALRGTRNTPRETPAISEVAAASLNFPWTTDAVRTHVRAALDEDQAHYDLSTLATVSTAQRLRCVVVSRNAGVIAGGPLAVEAFAQLDPAVKVQVHVVDGGAVQKGTAVMTVEGQARAVLSAERVALNYLQHLSGIASLTATFVDAVRGTSAKILDTRKTLPGWRTMQKYAVRAGGGVNHRMDLRSAVLIKDNHLAAIGGDVAMAVTRARTIGAPGMTVQVECDTLDQVRAALDAKADWVLLDNMSLDMLREAVTLCRGRAVTEASGGVSLHTVRDIASTGVDRISIGALTHSAPALDLGLDFAHS